MSYDGWATEEYIIKEHDIFVSVDLDEQIWVKGSGYDQKSYRASLSGNVLTWSENQSFNIGTKKYYHNGNCYAEYTKE